MQVKRANIETYTGRFVDILEPDPNTIHIVDVAHGLANQCRYGGQCKRFYSVASHSVLVSKLVEALNNHDPSFRDLSLLALLHDASEAYLVDIPTPVKKELSNYKSIEATLMDAVLAKFALPYEFRDMPEITHYADVLSLKMEAAILMKSKGKNYSAFVGFDEEDMLISRAPHVCTDRPRQAKRQFLARYYELTDNTRKWVWYSLLYTVGLFLPI